MLRFRVDVALERVIDLSAALVLLAVHILHRFRGNLSLLFMLLAIDVSSRAQTLLLLLHYL
jgi:hypothetical protein